MPRVLTLEEAADYCGCGNVDKFLRQVRKNIYPKPRRGDARYGWDKAALDRALDIEAGRVPDNSLDAEFGLA